MAEQSYVVGSTYRFEATIQKDGEDWNLATATVTLHLRRPDGTVLDRTASKAGGNVAYYQNTTAELNMPGPWRRSWRVVEGDVTLESEPISFTVVDSP